jgi:nitric oxide reductase NorQ protein
MAAINFDFLPRAQEIQVVAHESKISSEHAERLVRVAEQSRALRGRGLDEGISTRMLVHAAGLMVESISAHDACAMAMVSPLTDDPDLHTALLGFVEAQFGPKE